jgi:hypothetical protein
MVFRTVPPSFISYQEALANYEKRKREGKLIRCMHMPATNTAVAKATEGWLQSGPSE